MSKYLIHQYRSEVERLYRFGGSRKETSIRGAFQTLLNEYCKTRDFFLVPELDYKTKTGTVVYPDGTVKDALRLDWGYWESKDEDDDIDAEIEKKLEKGYPDDNILFEDSQTIVLIQGGSETLRVSMSDEDDFDRALNAFINYVRPEVKDFREAIESFKEDLPTILETLRETIAEQSRSNPDFVRARDKFLTICQESINPEVTPEDVREMAIQHILTEDIFINIFNESQFHRENNIACELQAVIDTFFTGKTRRTTLGTIERYYAVIRRTAANIYNHQEKQKFLKAVYENFYKAYNPKAADRLGIVYTPNEIVRFMVESTDYLLYEHFNTFLSDPGVEILDPAAGTGTFVTELIEYIPQDKLEHKYKHEIHCNEAAILPYYIANLNIEFTYKQKMEEYEEFNHICFVDTLDNTSFEGKQFDLFAMTVENTARIENQNKAKISVIIGNPPYNANQQNENDNNKNREYPAIDKLIKESYIRESTAQKTKLYDMYSRFFRWATGRLNEDGILAFVTNSSFINARTFDGFRKVVAREFSEIYIIDLGGDVRKNPKLSGTTHNVFGIQTGVAISFMVKKQDSSSTGCKIFYTRRPEMETAAEKLHFLATTKFDRLSFEHIRPDKFHNWINIADTNFKELVKLVPDKQSKKAEDNFSIYKFCTNGIKSNRDEWVYDFHQDKLVNKIAFFIDFYNLEVDRYRESSATDKIDNISDFVKYDVKWSESLKSKLKSLITVELKPSKIVKQLYRPFVFKYFYPDFVLNDRLTQHHAKLFGCKFDRDNRVIYLSGSPLSKPFHCMSANITVDYHFTGDSQCLPLYRYNKNGDRIDNITDWGLSQFQTYYNDDAVSKEDIFYYTYSVLHNPNYRKKYELNLKREFPRLPFYADFWKWKAWGEKLMDLHLNYETIAPYSLHRIDTKSSNIKPKLKADKPDGKIILDTATTLEDVPAIAWEYQLGNRSALEWILDQYKEKKPRDPTIRDRFNTYCFADYKETVIDLLQRVCTVSVETMAIVREMETEET